VFWASRVLVLRLAREGGVGVAGFDLARYESGRV